MLSAKSHVTVNKKRDPLGGMEVAPNGLPDTIIESRTTKLTRVIRV